MNSAEMVLAMRKADELEQELMRLKITQNVTGIVMLRIEEILEELQPFLNLNYIKR